LAVEDGGFGGLHRHRIEAVSLTWWLAAVNMITAGDCIPFSILH
jgi:hypothetical protein